MSFNGNPTAPPDTLVILRRFGYIYQPAGR
jgi:hypothetical protein